MKTDKLALIALVAMALVMSGCNAKKVSISETNEKRPTQQRPDIPSDPNGGNKETVIINDNIEIIDNTDLNLVSTSNMSTVNFAFDSSELDAENYNKVVENSAVVQELSEGLKIRIEGNCDSWGTDEYNTALGLKRANAVKKVMISEGVQEDRISLVSYGSMNSVCDEETSECFAKNRRVDFVELTQ